MTPDEGDVQAVTGVDISEAKENVVNKVDEVTPEAPAPASTPATDPGPAIDELRGVVETLATAVAVLTESVAGRADESPVKTPWTHRGGRKS